MKTCKMCREVKELSAFYANPSGREGTRPECKECTKARRKRWYLENREREIARVRAWQDDHPEMVRARMEAFITAGKKKISNRKSHLKRKYGLTLEEFDEILASQGGVCAICGRPDPDNVDHDHVTGRVRGILCWNCNIGVGHFEDEEDRLAAATAYVSSDPELAELAQQRLVALSS